MIPGVVDVGGDGDLAVLNVVGMSASDDASFGPAQFAFLRFEI